MGQPGGGVHRQPDPIGLRADVQPVGVGQQRQLQPLQPRQHLVQLQHRLPGLDRAQAPQRDPLDATSGRVTHRGQQVAGEPVHPLAVPIGRPRHRPEKPRHRALDRRSDRLDLPGAPRQAPPQARNRPRLGVRVLLHDSTMPAPTDSLSPMRPLRRNFLEKNCPVDKTRLDHGPGPSASNSTATRGDVVVQRARPKTAVV